MIRLWHRLLCLVGVHAWCGDPRPLNWRCVEAILAGAPPHDIHCYWCGTPRIKPI